MYHSLKQPNSKGMGDLALGNGYSGDGGVLCLSPSLAADSLPTPCLLEPDLWHRVPRESSLGVMGEM